MSDNGLTTDTAPPPEIANAPVGSAAGAPTPAPAVDPLDSALPDQPIFDRGYVESIRREAQRYRGEAQTAAQRAAQYEDVFGIYEPQDRDVWFNLARTWASSPEQAARWMQQIASGVLGDQTSMDNAPPQEQYEQPDENALTPDMVQQMIEEKFQTREQRAAEQRAVDDVMGEVRAQGFDPDTAEGFMVLWRANHETNGDIKAAAESVKHYRQSIIDEYVQGRSSGRVAMPTAGGVQATPNAEPIRSIEDARRATEAFLKERRGA